LKRILLSVPHMGGHEESFVKETFASNWLSTVGPQLDAFEAEFGGRIGLPAVALSSGTAAVHLGLRALGVGPGDEVFCQDLTFVGSVNPIRYLGADPVFIDSERTSWNMDPSRLEDALRRRGMANRLPRCVLVVHLYGQCADMDSILEICSRYDIPVLEDAAEAVGSTYKGRPAGSMGAVGIFSFNGNKIITTTGGGMLVAKDALLVAKVRHWSTQAREPVREYHHVELGYNFRLSNVLAAIGRGQLRVLDERVAQRRAVAQRYEQGFEDVPGLTMAPDAGYGVHTRWLSCAIVEAQRFGMDRDKLIQTLEAKGIETRPVWKPMHLQPLYQGADVVGGEMSEDLFHRGICFPSSSSLTVEDQDYIVECVKQAAGRAAA
jgi:pyridoxal phosphate-dependent aminotransferase EpsN